VEQLVQAQCSVAFAAESAFIAFEMVWLAGFLLFFGWLWKVHFQNFADGDFFQPGQNFFWDLVSYLVNNF
jgi:hypothetical protein